MNQKSGAGSYKNKVLNTSTNTVSEKISSPIEKKIEHLLNHDHLNKDQKDFEREKSINII